MTPRLFHSSRLLALLPLLPLLVLLLTSSADDQVGCAHHARQQPLLPLHGGAATATFCSIFGHDCTNAGGNAVVVGVGAPNSARFEYSEYSLRCVAMCGHAWAAKAVVAEHIIFARVTRIAVLALDMRSAPACVLNEALMLCYAGMRASAA
jgi:hypothetical protein